MATPQSTTSYEDSGSKKLEQITFRFCSECSNMLYPKEDEDAHKLQFTCRTCQYTEEAQSTCVFRNVLNNSAGETAGVTQDVGSDPTVSCLPPVICLHCGVPICCEMCGDLVGDATSRQWTSRKDQDEKEERERLSLSLFFSWSDCDEPFAEYDEELMDEIEMEPHSPTTTDSDSVPAPETYISDDVVTALGS
ncbi:DNA-directed RNA polymerase, M/15kDa subunit [Metarhizium album ARSEF 1941]|uniref:DNA-directed RNA polymerase, M/15kDa subunit n=1 Tax=Metarhizium album (strain ARSEF 1941) TaxID=1081103 RepID=A0A0B2X1V3_METAS|nr:DNA-directed RNA polymerase, M/15kDa subunit [Metarhizium album ARSEF 1941]KHN99697.1 DNA-directed RNA polymerase, M/15kDa subunit [Metarhizium album ARSEF 1941]